MLVLGVFRYKRQRRRVTGVGAKYRRARWLLQRRPGFRAVVGIVPVKVTSENGRIKPGDKLTTSSTPGHAMKADRHAEIGTVIGKALKPLEGDQGVIEMLVILQ